MIDGPASVTAQPAPGAKLPLLVSVTGHRDLVASELPAIRARVRAFLESLRAEYPEREITVLSGLAIGADQLVAEEVLALSLPLVAVLPMPLALYREDFSDQEIGPFEQLLERVAQRIELPLIHDEAMTLPGINRERQYAQLGVFLCAHCHILLALWDGKYTSELGGTSQVVQFHHDDIMPGFTNPAVATQQMLVDDESDLIYHVVCSRDRDEGAPDAGLIALDTCWYSKDPDAPRSAAMPAQHRAIFAHSAAFSADSQRFAERIAGAAYPLFKTDQIPAQRSGSDVINHWFCAADTLAMIYQKKVLLSLRVTHVLAFFMGLCFIIYADVQMEHDYMLAFLGLFAISAAIQQIGQRREWHRKYLDYRALAEGLRVQFYWSVAGVSEESPVKYPHDDFLQSQEPELGWVRNVMRVAGLHGNATPYDDSAALDYVLQEWIGDETSGQLRYFAARATQRRQRNRLTELLGLISLLTSVALVAVFVLAGNRMPDAWVDPLMAVMGALLLVYGIRQAYAYALAEKELIGQYEFMSRLFRSARARIDRTDNRHEQRNILRALGRAALDEHSDWLVMQRNRAIDKGELWRMSS